MFPLDVQLILLCVDQRRFRFDMAEQLLEHIQGHAAAQAGSGEGVPDPVREHTEAGTLGHFLDNILQRALPDRLVRRFGVDKQAARSVRPCAEIGAERNFRLGVEVNDAFLVSLAMMDENRSVVPVNV